MNFLKDAKAKVLEVVRGSNIQPDKDLAKQRERLSQLSSIVDVLQKNCHEYSTAVLDVSRTSTVLANDVSQFYIRSKERESSIRLFSEVNMTVEASGRQLFKDQFHRDVLVGFDAWKRKISNCEKELQAAEEMYLNLAKLQQKLQQAQETGDFETAQNLDGEVNMIQARLEAAKVAVAANVQLLIDTRYAVYDSLLVRLMECQMDFFKDAEQALSQMRGNAANYRKKFPQHMLVDDIMQQVSSRNGDLKREDDEEKPGQENRKPPPMAKVSSNDSQPRGAEPAMERRRSNEGGQAPQGRPQSLRKDPQPEAKKEQPRRDSFDLVSGFKSGDRPAPQAQSQAPSSQQSSQPSRPSGKPKQPVDDDIFGLARAPAPSKQNVSSSTEDLLFGSPAPPKKSQPAKVSSNSGFEEDLLFQPAPKSNGSVKKTGQAKANPSRPSAPAPAPQAQTQTQARRKDESKEPAYTEEKPTASNITEFIAQKQEEKLEQYWANENANAKLAEDKRIARNALDNSLDNWEMKNGVRKNLRTLLTTLHTVLWEGHGLKPIELSTLMNPAGVKKAYRNVMFVIHPDHVGKDATKLVIAERTFHAINEEWDKFRIENNM